MQTRKRIGQAVAVSASILGVCAAVVVICVWLSSRGADALLEPAAEGGSSAQEEETPPAHSESGAKKRSLELEIRSTPLTPAKETELLKLVQKDLVVPTEMADVPTKPIVVQLKQRFGKHFFPVRLNKTNATAMLDWGGGCFVGIAPSMALKARPRLCDHTMGGTSYEGSEEVRPGVLDEMYVGGERIPDVPVVVSEADVDVVIAGLPVLRGECLVGMPFLAAFRQFAIDSRKGKLHLGCLPELGPDEEALVVPCRYQESALWVPLKLEDRALDLVVDIGGSRAVVTLHGDVAREFMNSHEYTEGGETTGFGRGTTTWYLAYAESARLGDHELAKVPVVLVPDTALPQAGTVGSGLFGSSLVSVDLDSGQLSFVRRPEAGADEPVEETRNP